MLDIKDLAQDDYNNGMKYKDIAEKYGVSLNTIKSWKQRYKWNRKGVHTKGNVCTQNSQINKKDSRKEPIESEVKEVLKNTGLTDKQRLFCIYYIKYFNATKAYQKAYGCSYTVANSEGYKLLVKPCVKAEIENLKQHKLNRAMLSSEDIFQKYMDIAFSDITDYVEFGRKEIEIDKDKDDKPIKVEVNYVDFKDSFDIDGTIVSEISQGKNGVSIKLQDKMKALQWLSDHMNIASDEQLARIEVLKSKVIKNDSKEDKIDDYFSKLEEVINGIE